MHAARAKSGQSAAQSLDGRVRERVRWYPYAPQYGSHHPDAGRALHARPWVNETDPYQGMHPRAGRASEGQIRGTRKSGSRAAHGATAAASIGHSLAPVNRFPRCESGVGWIRTPCAVERARVEPERRSGPEGLRDPGTQSARSRLSLGTPAHGKTGPCHGARGTRSRRRGLPPAHAAHMSMGRVRGSSGRLRCTARPKSRATRNV